MAQIGETELDVRALARALWRRSWLLVLLAVIAAVGTYVGLGFVDPLYTADTRILIEERESPLTRSREGTAVPSADFDESAIQSQVEVLRSREIAEAVINKLNLTSRPEFDPARQPSLLRSILVMLGIRENPTDSTIRQRVMDAYFERLSVFPLQKSRVIGVEFSAPNPTLAAEVANAVADAFVTLQQDAKRESAVAATSWLQQEIERLRARVAEAEQAVADYREKEGLFDVDRPSSGQGGADAANLSTQQLGEINAELARARAARAEAEARAQLVAKLLEEGGPLDASEEVLNSQLIQRLRERQGALSAQMAELSTTLLPTHPRIRALQEQIGSLDGQIRQETSKVLASLETAARVAAAREESLVGSLNEAKGDVSRSNDQGIELRALQREAAAQRELLESFLSRYREAAARTDANYLPADARIISRAIAPVDPSFPKKTMMAIAAAVAMLLIASAIVLLFEFTSGRAFRVIGYYPDERTRTMPAEDPAPVAAPSRREEPEATLLADGVDEPRVHRVGRVDRDEPKVHVVADEPDEPDEPIPSVLSESDDQEALLEPEEHPLEAETQPVEQTIELEPKPEPARFVQPPIDGRRRVEPPAADVLAELEEVRRALDALPVINRSELVPAQPPVARETEPPVPPRAEREPEPRVPPGVERELETPVTLESKAAPSEEASAPAGLGEILSSASVRVALFAGAEGGEGAGAVAFSAAREAAQEKVRSVVIDVGSIASETLGNERPGLADLLAGNAVFGEVIRRDDSARVHWIPLGSADSQPSMQRMQLVINALTHTYDKVIVVADKLDDWPDEFVKPDVAAIVCGPETTESLRTEVYDVALARGAHSALIVRYSSDSDFGGEASAAA
jgi:polysaccharide biosynthesis transport protein